MFESPANRARSNSIEMVRKVPSPTQQLLTGDQAAQLVTRALDAPVVAASALTGGGFAAVWKASLADGREVVLKVGPAPDVPLLEYEAGMIAAEAAYLRLVADIAPVPSILYADDDTLITTFRPGTPLTAFAGDAGPVRRDLGAAMARIHQLRGPFFGYTGDRPCAATWPDAFAGIVAGLLRDADRWGVEVPARAIAATIEARADDLAQVREPALLHFDLWDGNVLATVDDYGVASLSGLVDGERYLYGDPLVDFVSPCLRGRMEEEPDHPYLAGYGSPTLDASALRRLGLYRMWLYLLMLVEMPSRGMTGPESEGRLRWVTDNLHRELALPPRGGLD